MQHDGTAASWPTPVGSRPLSGPGRRMSAVTAGSCVTSWRVTGMTTGRLVTAVTARRRVTVVAAWRRVTAVTDGRWVTAGRQRVMLEGGRPMAAVRTDVPERRAQVGDECDHGIRVGIGWQGGVQQAGPSGATDCRIEPGGACRAPDLGQHQAQIPRPVSDLQHRAVRLCCRAWLPTRSAG